MSFAGGLLADEHNRVNGLLIRALSPSPADMQLSSHVGTEKIGTEPDVSRGLQLVTGQNPKLNAWQLKTCSGLKDFLKHPLSTIAPASLSFVMVSGTPTWSLSSMPVTPTI